MHRLSGNRNGDLRSWLQVIFSTLVKAVKINTSNTTALRAIRGAIGLGVPLALGVMTHHIEVGVSIAGGAASMGSVGLTDPRHTQTRTMVFACIGIAFSAFMGSITSYMPWLSILCMGLWGFGAGMLVALGTRGLVIGLQSVTAFIVLSHFQLDPVHAVLQALLMLVGALFQLLLVLIPSPLPGKRTSYERVALANVYDILATYAENASDDQLGLQIGNALLDANRVVSASNLKSPQGALFGGLLEEAERLRLDILLFRHWWRRLMAEPDQNARGIKVLDSFMHAVADQLRLIADELRASQHLMKAFQKPSQVKDTLDDLRKEADAFGSAREVQPLLKYSESLRCHLHTVRKLARSLGMHSRKQMRNITLPETALFNSHPVLASLRANMTLRSATFRHAIRMGVGLVLAGIIFRFSPLPIHNGYWIPLTVLLVLRPDFNTTFTRGFSRLLGTVIGALLTTLLMILVAPTPETLVIFNVIAAYLAYSVLFASYTLFSLFFTVGIVCLLTFVTPYPVETALYRTVDTIVGGALALLIYLAWPTWERMQSSDYLAERVDTVRHYCVAVLKTLADPGSYDRLKLEQLHTAARLARTNAEASLQRSLQEPQPRRINTDVAVGILSSCDHIIGCALSLESYIQANTERDPIPEIAPLAGSIDEALRLLVTIIRGSHSNHLFPDLQQELRDLKRKLKATDRILARIDESKAKNKDIIKSDRHFMLTEVKHMIDSIDLLYNVLAPPDMQGTSDLAIT